MFRTFAIAMGLCLSMSANAAMLRWTFQDVQFDDGGTLAGYFDFDATTNTCGEINFSTTAGSIHPAAHYGYLHENCVPAQQRYYETASPTTGTGIFNFNNFGHPLTDAGGIIAVTPGISWEATCGAGGSCGVNAPQRLVISGYVTTAPVPVPPAIWLFGSAIGLMGVMRRKISS